MKDSYRLKSPRSCIMTPLYTACWIPIPTKCLHAEKQLLVQFRAVHTHTYVPTHTLRHHFTGLIWNLHYYHASPWIPLQHESFPPPKTPPPHVTVCQGICGGTFCLVSHRSSQNGREIFIPSWQIDWCLIHQFKTLARLTLDSRRWGHSGFMIPH